MREDAPIFTSDFSVRQPLKTPPELVTLQLGEPNSETPTPASPPPRNRSSMLRLAYPPGGDPLDFPDTPLALVVVDVAELAPVATPPTKSVIYAALGLPPPGDPLDFPDTHLSAANASL